MHAVEIIHTFRLWLISGRDIITRQAENIAHTEGGCTQHIPLNRNAVFVTA